MGRMHVDKHVLIEKPTARSARGAIGAEDAQKIGELGQML
jgi:hypothetical protein